MAAGIEKGDRIAIWAPNIYQWIIAAIGAQSVGGVLVPLNTRSRGRKPPIFCTPAARRLLFTVGEFLGVSYPDMLLTKTCLRWSSTVLLRRGGGLPVLGRFLAAGRLLQPEVARARGTVTR